MKNQDKPDSTGSEGKERPEAAQDKADSGEKKEDPPHLTAEEARQGRIVLNTPTRRAVFFGGLILFVLLVFFGMLFG